MGSSRRRLSILALLGAGLAGTARGQASGPRDIVAGPDHSLWFTESIANRIGRITVNGDITGYPIPSPGSGPSGIAVGPDGNLWFTEAAAGKIGRIDMDCAVTEFALPAASRNRGPSSIVAGPDGNLWFTEARGGRVGRITTAGTITEFAAASFSSPGGITSGPDGNLWFTDSYGYGANVARMTTAGVATEFSTTDFPYSFAPIDITVGQDHSLWFVPSATGGVGRLSTGAVAADFAIPSPGDLRGITAGSGVLWFTEWNANQIGRISQSGNVAEFPIPTAGSGPSGIASGPDGNIWFTESKGDRIGRITPAGEITEFAISTEQPSCTTDARTLCLNGGRFQVRAEWQVPSQGSSGHGNAVPLTGDTGTFWFFQASSIEVIVKVLDGCSENGHAWVFAAGLTNVGVTLTVTDTQTDEFRTYTNPADTAFQPIQDTTAFAPCP
jgi:streptogramin lyase